MSIRPQSIGRAVRRASATVALVLVLGPACTSKESSPSATEGTSVTLAPTTGPTTIPASLVLPDPCGLLSLPEVERLLKNVATSTVAKQVTEGGVTQARCAFLDLSGTTLLEVRVSRLADQPRGEPSGAKVKVLDGAGRFADGFVTASVKRFRLVIGAPGLAEDGAVNVANAAAGKL